MTKEGKSFLAGSVAFVLFAMMRNMIPLHNMKFFIAACVFSTAVALLAYFVMQKRKSSVNPAVEKAWSILAVVLLGIWLILFYINETDTEQGLEETELIRRYFPFPLWMIFMLVGLAVCLFVLRREPREKSLEIRKKIRAGAAVLFAFGTSIQFYAPNIFQDIQGSTYHSHAYTNSIINVCWLIPYSEDMESLYGHYAILYMPVLKFLHKCFHMDYLTGIFVVSAVIAGISILFLAWVLNYFAKSDLIFYLAVFAVGEEYFMLMKGGVYLQVHPHRMIFPIVLAALALQEYKRKKKYDFPALCVLTLSLIWSTEVGIVTMFSFALYRWALLVMDGASFSFKKIFLLVRELAIYVLLPFVLSYTVINGYNLLAGGVLLDLREFMFPLISDRDYIEQIELALPDVTHAWIGAAILFLGAVFPTLFQVFFPTGEDNGKKPFYFLIGIMSLALMLYYINRPVEGCMFIILFLMLILQAAVLQKGQDVYLEWKESKDSVFAKPNRFSFLSLRVITVFLLFVMAFDSIYSMPGAWRTSAQTIWKRDELMEFAEYVYYQVPPDAVSFGEGVPELMSLIDRDTHLHSTEWSYLNMPLDTMERMRYELEDAQWLFCSLYSLWYLSSNYPGLTDNFYLHEEFEYNGVKFGLFRRTDEAG